jgi:hypothetical protein
MEMEIPNGSYQTSKDITQVLTKFWGTSRISERSTPPEPGPTHVQSSYVYRMPKNGGEGVIIYILETSVDMGMELPNYVSFEFEQR